MAKLILYLTGVAIGWTSVRLSVTRLYCLNRIQISPKIKLIRPWSMSAYVKSLLLQFSGMHRQNSTNNCAYKLQLSFRQCWSPRGPIYKSLSMDHKVLETFQGLSILQTVRYVWSCDVHKFCYRHHHHARGYGEDCATYWCQICQQVSHSSL